MNRLKEFLAVAVFCAASACFADAVFEISDKEGNLDASINSVPFIKSDSLSLMDSKWKILCSPKSSKAVASTTPIGDSVCEWSATPGCSLVRTLSKEKDGARLKYEFAFAPGQEGKHIELCLHVPKACLDFPKDSLSTGVFEKPISLQTLSGKVVLDPDGSIGGKWNFDDMREVKWSGMFRIRFSGEYDPASGSKGVAALSIKAEQGASSAFLKIPLGKAATRTFADDASHSGWTAHGHANDLSKMPLGLLVCSGVPFDVKGQAAILKSANTPDFPVSSGVIKIEPAALCGSFYFLHTAFWCKKSDVPVAKYKILYADGSSADVPLRPGREIADWWPAQGTLNAKLAWKGLNGGGEEVGVYMFKAANLHPEKAVAGIEFISENRACAPALLAITAINSSIATKGQQEELDKIFSKPSEAPLDTSSWHKCAIAWNGGIEPGSAIDFSFLNHKPAGKFGFLKRVGGEFEFEGQPGKAVRFWGTNFSIEGPFPDKKLAPGIAKTIAAQGANIVRMGGYAARPTLLQSKDGGLNPEMLDKVQFFIAELEKNGVYIYMDFNDGMCYDQLLKRPSTFRPEEYLLFASLFDPELKKATKRLAELFFTAVNPYNGKALVNDPGVAMFETMNEVSMLTDWKTTSDYFKGKEPYAVELKGYWEAWLKSNNLEIMPLPRNFNGDPVGRRFATEMDKAYLTEMHASLRSLGVKVPICGTNITFSNGNFVASAQMDFMADHDYWAHPDFKSKPMAYQTSSALSRPVWTPPVGSLGKCALKNYPVVHGEWNDCFPNAYRCEGIPTYAAYAAYQGWDGMIFYGATGSCDDGRWNRFLDNPGIMIHSQQTDPATWGLSQVGAAMFRRGDVEQAQRVLEAVLPESAIYENLMAVHKMPFLPALGRFEISFSKDGKGNWLGDLAESGKPPAELYADVLKHLGDTASTSSKIVSDTKQLRRYATPPLLLVDTPRTQSATGRLCDIEKAKDSLSDLKFTSQMAWGSLNAVALDDAALKDSKRILLVAVGNAANTGERVENGYLLAMGKAPVLMEPFKADVSLNLKTGKAKVFALNPLTGARESELKADYGSGTLNFKLDGSQNTIYFEIVTE